MKRLSIVLVLLFTACGSATEGPTTPGGPAAGSGSAGGGAPAAAGDVSIEIPAAELKGLVFEPEGLARPSMPKARAKKALSLENQRKKYQVTKDPVQKQAEAAILATMLFEEARTKSGEEQTKLVTEARQIMRDVSTAVGPDKVDELTLQMLGSYEIQLEDWAAAEKAFGIVVPKLTPKDESRTHYLALWAYALLKQYKNAEALDLVKAEQPNAESSELAYAIAWAKWRGGDAAGAWDAINTAATKWDGDRAVIERDIMLFAGRSNSLKLDVVLPKLFEVFKAKQPAQQYEVLAKLGLQSYGFAGRWAEGVAALDKAIATAGTTVPPNDLPVLRYSQADFTVRLDNPAAAAGFAKQALTALGTCGAKCTDKDKQDLISAVAILGRLFHILYATANDTRYYQPANDLYIAVIPMIADAGRRTEVNRDAETLQRTLKNTKPGTGTHDKGAVAALLGRHNQEVLACYEAGLVTNPKIGGTLTVNLESDASGAIKAVTTEPKAGGADMGWVATCVTEQAKTWHLPKRGMAGSTHVKMSFAMSRRNPAAN